MTYKYYLRKLNICFLLIFLMSFFCCCNTSSDNFADNSPNAEKPFVTITEENTENSLPLPDTADFSTPDYTVTEPKLPDKEATVQADIPSLLTFLRIALEPACSTMYVWGGGWNEEDTGAGIEAVTLGVSPKWADFAARQNASYDYTKTRYQIHDGLDCSGYVGWAVYNVMETENRKEGYVIKSTQMAQHFSERGLGEYIPAADVQKWQPGDICSMKGHVWISLGMCSDNSVLLLHASPPGVIFSGTLLPDGSVSEAVKLAEQITQTYYPDWYKKYPDCSRSHSYLPNSSVMRWNTDILSDHERIQDMSANEVIKLLFHTKQ